MNVFYKTFAVAFAMFATFATNAVADERYHATSVQCRVGISTDTETLDFLGVTEDSCEIWGAQKNSTNYAYFWCDIDGKSYSVHETNIKTNTEYTLEETGFWTSMLLRSLPSSLNQSYFVKIKSNNSGENKFVSYTFGDILDNMDSWHVAGGNVYITPLDTPVYDASTDTYSQDIYWGYEGIKGKLVFQAQVFVSYDGGETWEATRACTSKGNEGGMSRTLTVNIPGDKKSVRYGLSLQPYDWCKLVAANGEWGSEPSKEFILNKNVSPVSPTPGGGGSSSVIGGGGGATGPDSTLTKVNTTTAKAKLVDIYDVSGVCVARKISLDQAAATLKRGIYVVNKKKMVLGK